MHNNTMRYSILFLISLGLYAQDSRIIRLLDTSLNVSQRNDPCMELRGMRSPEVVDADVIDAMTRALEHPQVRSCAARSLSEVQAVDALKKALGHNDPEIRATAARELGTLQLPDMMATLAQTARDENLIVATSAFQGLSHYQDRRVLPYLLDLASAGGMVGTLALGCAIQFQDPSVVPVARHLLDSRDAPLRLAALRAIGELGDASDIPTLAPMAAKSEPLNAGGRGFGFAPAVDLSLAAKNAMRMIQERK